MQTSPEVLPIVHSQQRRSKAAEEAHSKKKKERNHCVSCTSFLGPGCTGCEVADETSL